MQRIERRILADKASVQTVKVGRAVPLFVEGDRAGRNVIHIWFVEEVSEDPDEPQQTMEFLVVGDGQEFPDGYLYVGSVFMRAKYHAHVFVQTEERVGK